MRGWKRPLVNVQPQLQYKFQNNRGNGEKLRHGTLWVAGSEFLKSSQERLLVKVQPSCNGDCNILEMSEPLDYKQNNCCCGVEPTESSQAVCAEASTLKLRRW